MCLTSDIGRDKIIFTDKIMQPPFCWWHYFGTIYICLYVFSLCRHPIMLKFSYMCGLGFIFFLASLWPYLYDKLDYTLI